MVLVLLFLSCIKKLLNLIFRYKTTLIQPSIFPQLAGVRAALSKTPLSIMRHHSPARWGAGASRTTMPSTTLSVTCHVAAA